MKEIPTPLLVVAGALARSDGCWLLHRRPDHKHHGGLWEFPGGKVEDGESPRAALVRELREELGIGIDARDLSPVAFADAAPGEGASGIVILLYTLTAWTGEPVALEPGAHIAWFAPADLRDAAMPPLDLVLREWLPTSQGGG